MDAPTACPDDATLRAALREGVQDDLLVHLASCDGCRARMTALEADDRFLARARAALADDPGVAAAADDLVPGYVLRRVIAQGGQGTVHEAVEEGSGRRVALKILGRRARITTKERLRFEREAQLASRLHHPNIARVLAAGTARDGRPYLVMEFVEGVPLDEHPLHRAARDALGRDPAAHRAAIDLLRTLAEAMAVAHGRGVIHRDLKPSNVLVDAEGRPHVIDFGLARTAHPDVAGATVTGEFVGSVAYAAPEQLAGEREVDARADVHALGVIGYELLLGEGPYREETSIGRTVQARLASDPRPPRRIDGRIDRDLDAILRFAVARDPDRRYPSAEAFARDLRLHLEGRPIEVRRDSSWYVVRRTISRHRFAIGAATLLLVVAIAVVAIMTMSWRRATDAEALARGRAEALERAVLRGELEQARLALAADDVVRAEALAWSVAGQTATDDDGELASIGRQADWLLRALYERAPALHAARLPSPVRPGVMGWTGDGATIEILGRDDLVLRWRPDATDVPIVARADERMVAVRGQSDHPMPLRDGVLELATEAGAVRRVPMPDGDDPVLRVAVDRAGAALVACRRSGRIEILDGEGRVRSTLARGSSARIAVSPTGRWAALSDEDGRVGIWDLAALRRVGAIGNERGGNVRFAPDESMVAIAEAGEIALHRLGGLGRVRTLSGLHTWATDLAFDADGRRLAAAGWDRIVAMWRVADGALLAALPGHGEDVWGVAFDPSGGRLASIDAGGEVRVWSAVPVGTPQRIAFGALSVLDLARIPGTDLVAAGLESGEVALVELDARHVRARWPAHDGVVGAVAALPDGSGLISAGYDGTVRCFAPDGTPRWSTSVGGIVSDVAVDPTGRRMAVAGVDGRVQLLDVDDGSVVGALARHARRVAVVAFSPDGALLASGGVDGELAVGPVAGGAPAIVGRLAEGVLRSCAFDPTGTRIAFAGDDRRVHLVELATGREEAAIGGHRGSVFAVAFDSTGTRLASLDAFGELHIAIGPPWSTALSTRVHDTMGFAVLFAPGDETVVTASRDGSIAVRPLDAAAPSIAGMRSFWRRPSSAEAATPDPAPAPDQR